MKKLWLIVAGMAFAAAPIFSQTRHYEVDFDAWDGFNRIEISQDNSHVETSVGVAFPMYFGTSVLSDISYNGEWGTAMADYPGFQDMRTSKNFFYALEMVALHVHAGHVEMTAGLRWTFMDFTFKNPAYTLRGVGSGPYMPASILSGEPTYNYDKSKIHATYFGIPVRVGLEWGRSTLYVGASAELLVNGYTKYKHPKERIKADAIFNDFRATLEAGFSWNNIGVFVMYGLTPLFPNSLSNARTVSFGLTLGL